MLSLSMIIDYMHISEEISANNFPLSLVLRNRNYMYDKEERYPT